MRTIPVGEKTDETQLATSRQTAYLGDLANPDKYGGLSDGHRISIRKGLRQVREGTHVLAAADAHAEIRRTVQLAKRVYDERPAAVPTAAIAPR